MGDARDARAAAMRQAEERSALDAIITTADQISAYKAAIDDIRFLIDGSQSAMAQAIRIILQHHGITP